MTTIPSASDIPANVPAVTTLRIGTLNVDQLHEDYSLLFHLLKEKELDIIGLQEMPKAQMPSLAAALGDYHWCESHSVAILSHYALENTTKESPNGHVRHCRARITIPGHPLEVTCVHLDRKKESTRLSEVRLLKSLYDLNNSSTNQRNMLWLGDFDALTRSDYSDDAWSDIAKQRSLNSWEEPVDELSTFLADQHNGLGLTDAWKAASQNAGPIETCRFGTRVDYVYASPAMMKAWQVQSCEHIDAAPVASDHNLVVATLVKRQG